ncbi:alanine racemase [Candidatus Nomurabacteria bacterium]|nr:alanine racemase [Candidatus Nomurabacteria bacterium]
MKTESLSRIELSRASLIHNIKQFKSLANKGTKFAVAIKGNAYGHGQNEIAKIIEPYIDYFQVDDVEELEQLRRVSRKKTLVLGYVQKSDLKKSVELGCTLSIFSLKQASTLSLMAKSANVIQEVQVPVDAYLGREGFLLSELPKLFREIKKHKNIKLTGIYAHFANIEDTIDFSHAQKQIAEFDKAIKLAGEFKFKDLQTHISATSGLLIYEKNKKIHPLVRLGIGVYGMWPSKQLRSLYLNKIFNLKPAMSWKTKIAQVKVLPAGMTIGYGLTFKTKKETKIAVIPQGYADGFDRGFSNNGEVLIHKTRCKILGRVMMNMFVVDVSHLKNAKQEDEVVILGKQGKEQITAEELAERINTINYEITTRVSALLPRVVK